jgi:hypothetical protein
LNGADDLGGEPRSFGSTPHLLRRQTHSRHQLLNTAIKCGLLIRRQRRHSRCKRCLDLGALLRRDAVRKPVETLARGQPEPAAPRVFAPWLWLIARDERNMAQARLAIDAYALDQNRADPLDRRVEVPPRN